MANLKVKQKNHQKRTFPKEIPLPIETPNHAPKLTSRNLLKKPKIKKKTYHQRDNPDKANSDPNQQYSFNPNHLLYLCYLLSIPRS